MDKAKDLVKWFFKDDKGKYAIIAPPNLPLMLIIIGYVMTTLIHTGPIYHLFSALQHGAVFLWSYLEIRYGESPFRRALGAVVMIAFLYGTITNAT